MRPQFRPWIAALFAAISLSNLYPAPIERLIEDHVVVDRNGNAQLTRTHDASKDSGLQQLYARYAEQTAKNPAMTQDHLKEESRALSVLYGVRSDLNSKRPFTKGEKLFAEPEARLRQLAHIDSQNPAIRVIASKGFSQDPKRLFPYFEFFLDEFIFESAYLATRDSDKMITTLRTRYRLPEGATLLHGEDLEKLNWTVNFGGGNTLDSHLQLEGTTVIVERRIVITKEPPTKLLDAGSAGQKVRDDFTQFEKYAIQYTFPGAEKNAGGGGGGGAPPAPPLDFDREWKRNVPDLQKYEKTFTEQNITATLAANLSAKFIARLHWDWDWPGSGGFRISQFESTLTATPALDLTASVEASSKLDWTSPSVPLFAAPREVVVFWVGLMPVEITLKAELSARAKTSLSATLNLSASARLEYESKLRCTYTPHDGWLGDHTGTFTPAFNPPTASAQATATLRGELPLELSALLYDAAGPYVELTPFMEAGASTAAEGTIPPPKTITTPTGSLDYKIKGGIDLEGGIRVNGWLAGLLGSKSKYDVAKKTIP